MEHTPDEFREIYDEFHPRILRYVGRMVGETDAEDLAQEVFARVAASLSGFRGESQVGTWIYRIASNAAMDRFRGAARRPEVELADAEQTIPDQNVWTGEPEPAPEARVYRGEMNDCIRGFVARLPENYRAVLALADFEGLSNQEIADVLGLTLETVKIRLHRAREKLRTELAANCGSEWIEGNEFLPELK